MAGNFPSDQLKKKVSGDGIDTVLARIVDMQDQPAKNRKGIPT
ncbi:hypothetical protein ACVDG8_025680 [Mesorhizobium sp. ORM8.1]